MRMRPSRRGAVTLTVVAMCAAGVPAFAGGHGGGVGGGGGGPGTRPYVEFKGGGSFTVTEGTASAVIQIERVPKGTDQVLFSTNGSPNGAAGAANCSDPATDYVVVTNAVVNIGSNGVGVANVQICNNTFFENQELVNLLLSQKSGSSPVGGKITGTLTINDNDKAPALSVNSKTGAEGTTQTFTVTASSANPLLPMSVHWSTSDGTGTSPPPAKVADGDYNTQSGDLAFVPGATTMTFDVTSLNDGVFEPGPDEYFWVNLSSPVNASISSTAGSSKDNLQDINSPPTLTIDDVTNWEGNVIGFTVTRHGMTTGAATFDWATSPGTATATAVGSLDNVCSTALPNDYVSGSANDVSIPAGGATNTVAVNVTTCEDLEQEDNETFTVNLSDAAFASISDNSGTGTIKDNDPYSLTVTPKGGSAGSGDSETYNALVTNTAGDELSGVLVRFEAYATDFAEYDSSGFTAFRQFDLTGPGFAGFDVTGDDIDVNSNPASESDGQATVVVPPTGATYANEVVGCVVTAVAASPSCGGITDHDDDADADPRTGENVTIDISVFPLLEDGGFQFIV